MKKALATLGMALALALGGTALQAIAPTQQAQAASWCCCYVDQYGGYWCYRYGCSAREEMAGCYQGYVYQGRVWYA